MQEGDTALLHAANGGHLDTVNLLLQSGANKDRQNKVLAICVFYGYCTCWCSNSNWVLFADTSEGLLSANAPVVVLRTGTPR